MAASAASTSSTLHGAGRALEVVRIRARGGLLRHGTPTAFWSGAARAVLAAMGEHDDAGRPDLGPVRRMLGRVASLGVWGAGRSLHLPVPTSLAASRVAMTAFAQAWSRYVGPCRVRLVRDADDAAALLASRGGGGRRRVTVRRARRWIEASEPRTTR